MSENPPNDNSPAASAPVGRASAVAAMVGKPTYGQILKSSALIGGSSVLNIVIGILRTKVMAILLSPAGLGLKGLYGSILDLALNVAGMGINSSGVRQIAGAVSSGDNQRIARTAVVLRRTAFALGLLGAVVLAAFSLQTSKATFGSDRHAGAAAKLDHVDTMPDWLIDAALSAKERGDGNASLGLACSAAVVMSRQNGFLVSPRAIGRICRTARSKAIARAADLPCLASETMRGSLDVLSEALPGSARL